MVVAEEQHHSSAVDTHQESQLLELVVAGQGSRWAEAQKETDYSADID